MVCRAFTFINYHIPLPKDMGVPSQYTTIGFFDGLFTERLEFNYSEEDLKPLWKYTLRKTAESQGSYSYQNVFGFSMDEWNDYTDAELWSERIDLEYPLTFVVFLQLNNYMVGEHAFEEQCRQFNQKLQDTFGEKGRYYTYGTIDKNDIIVTIKSRKYKETVKAIKKLHTTKESVVYSYTIFSINKEVLKEINNEKYKDLYEEYIDSICLKGITNSFDPTRKVPLDKRYYEFSEELVSKIYLDEIDDNKIYDILGDDDFRLIARNVSLGKLLEQYGPGGMFSYGEKKFRFYLFSSSMVLNSLTVENTDEDIEKKISESHVRIINNGMDKEFVATNCEELEKQMHNISEVIQNPLQENNDEKVITFCHALWQLLQSLKVLETAPTKKYDFYSLYHPFSSLIRILEDKMKNNKLIGEYESIYEFIHKISMTLHGTLRTDIQFFQIKDFNVIVHYAPAKLRAFYSIWVLKLSEYYNGFCKDRHRYSFIFSPGMFPGVVVRQIFTRENEEERLMLITSPERHIYAPKWLTIVMAHEVSHFVGGTLRRRKKRHFVWLEMISRILELELNSFLYKRYWGNLQEDVEKRIGQDEYIFDHLIPELKVLEEETRKKEIDQAHTYHSKKSVSIIRDTYRKAQELYLGKILKDYIALLGNFLVEQEMQRFPRENKAKVIKDITVINMNRYEQLMLLTEKFLSFEIKSILELLKYITSETFADLVAIFSLNLSLKSYILTYIKSEFPANTGNEGDKLEDTGVPMVVVRIGILTRVISELIDDYRVWFERKMPGFVDGWGDAALKKIYDESPKNNQEKEMAFNVMLYLKNIRDHKRKIGSYISLYDDSKEKGVFSSKKIDFLRDEKILDGFCDYLLECAKTYIKVLDKDEKLQEQHDYFVATHYNLSNGLPINMMQEIENFLAKYENDIKNK